jgi:hypothetical protein
MAEDASVGASTHGDPVLRQSLADRRSCVCMPGVALSPLVLAVDDVERGSLAAPAGFDPDGSQYGLIWLGSSEQGVELELAEWLQAQFSSAPADKGLHNLYFVGAAWSRTWATDTPEGIILLDALSNQFEAAEAGLRRVGLDPARIRTIVVSHGHGDHHGPTLGWHRVQLRRQARSPQKIHPVCRTNEDNRTPTPHRSPDLEPSRLGQRGSEDVPALQSQSAPPNCGGHSRGGASNDRDERMCRPPAIACDSVIPAQVRACRESLRPGACPCS